jgi:pimeloyl-ACP methyl ester carboxylesterase
MAVTARPLSLATPALHGAAWPTWQTAAWLTIPDTRSRDELHLLLHGAAYDHRYWDWPVNPEVYSYTRWAADRGIATLAIDRIGNGSSTRPPGRENTIEAQSDVVDHLARAARSGLDDGPPFTRVVLVGHSLGSVVAGHAAAVHGCADAVVLTGYLPSSTRSPRRRQLVDAGFVPALERFPHLRGLVDDDYLAPIAGGRARVMYWHEQADPAIIEIDEALTGTATRGELQDAASAGNVIRSSVVPTLVVVGQHDRFIGARGTEVDGFVLTKRSAAETTSSFEYEVVPETGHCLNLHHTAHRAFAAITGWLDEAADSERTTDGCSTRCP